MRPPKRQKKNTEASGSSGEALWTLPELKALLGALKSYPLDDYEAIKKCLPERSLNEVKVAIERLRVQNPARVVGTYEAAPIERWRQKSEQLLKYDVDHSRVLSQVMSSMATLEPQTRKRGLSDPNYHAIYRYLGALMNKESPPALARMDAVALLDILDGLADHLTSLDTSDQQVMMRQKYTLLRDRVNLYSQKNILVAVKTQLKKDTFESCRQPATTNSPQGPPESRRDTASTDSTNGEHRAHTTNATSTSDVNKETLDINEATSDINEPMSDVTEATSDVNKATLDINEATSDVNEPTSNINEPMSDVNELTSDINEPMSDGNEATSDDNKASGKGTEEDHDYSSKRRGIWMSSTRESRMLESRMRESSTRESRMRESRMRESRMRESRMQESTTQDRVADMCGVYCLNPFCIEQKYLQPESNSS